MPKTVVIVGAVALGPKAACRLKRLEPEARVIMVDRDDIISYGGCGIPYFISGDVSDPEQLQATSFHMVRDPKFFLDCKDVDVRTRTEAVSIDRQAKTLKIRQLPDGPEEYLSYDYLVLGTGSRPRDLPLPGRDLEGVYAVSSLNKAISIKKDVAEGKVGSAVVIGAGAIGLEIAESLADLWGIETTIVEIADQILPGIVGPTIARMARHHLEEQGITIHLNERVERLEGEGRVNRVVTQNHTLDADLVIVAAGVLPNAELARTAGLTVSERGAIVVNDRMQTSDSDIYAGGDCVEIPNRITGKPGYWPLGSLANRQGRVIGTNLAGGDARFPGAVGSFVIKLFDISMASAGLTLQTARKEGLNALNAFVVQFDRAHFYPEKDLLYLELIVEKGSGRVLGIQGLGNTGDGLLVRVSAVAPLLGTGITTQDVSNLELPYSPPFSSAMDILNALGNTAENTLQGKNRVIEPGEFARWWTQRNDGNTLFLDCREWGNAGEFVEKYPDCWKSVPQGELRRRLEEVPRDKRLVLICNTGVRSYEAQITLDQMGFHDTFNLSGGMAAVKKWGLDI